MSVVMEPSHEERPDDRELRVGLKLSFAFHIVLAAFILLKSFVFPADPIPIPPVLRVDIVGLPDMLKTEKDLAEQLREAEDSAQAVKSPSKSQPAKPDEMVVKPKTDKATDERRKLDEQNKLAEASRITREKRMKSALNRMKSLSKITGESESSAVVKGNKVSAGSSMSDDARESGEASYYDALREHLQQNWALPVWLARQKQLGAQVILYIDSRGQMRSMDFLKRSGSPQFDEQVKRTLQESQPFPIPPAAVARDVLNHGVRIGFPL